MPKKYSILERRLAFWNKVLRLGPNDCWEWLGTKSYKGYGMFWNGDTMIQAHRFILEDKIPLGMLACHKCDNRACVNPKHIFFGTNLDNVRDCIDKNRFPSRIGENNGRHKLINRQIRYIKAFPRYYGSSAILGRQFGLTRGSICDIRNGKKWKHI